MGIPSPCPLAILIDVLNSSVTATLHRGPLENNVTNVNPVQPQDVTMTTASRPLSTSVENPKVKQTSAPKPGKSRRPLFNGAHELRSHRWELLALTFVFYFAL